MGPARQERAGNPARSSFFALWWASPPPRSQLGHDLEALLLRDLALLLLGLLGLLALGLTLLIGALLLLAGVRRLLRLLGGELAGQGRDLRLIDRCGTLSAPARRAGRGAVRPGDRRMWRCSAA
jgi:membrane protein implicated in regulation of membrane protease activity